MALPKEQIEQIKQQIIEQIESTFPEDKKADAIEKIKLMDETQLEEFLVQNNLIKSGEGEKECIFCSILSEKIPSYKIAENPGAIAVLDINPISRGHTLILPIQHVKEIPLEVEKFAKKISEQLKRKLDAKEMHIEKSEMFGHGSISIIPIYDEKTLENSRQQAPKDILEKLQNELRMEKPETKEKEEKEEQITEKNTWLPKRLP